MLPKAFLHSIFQAIDGKSFFNATEGRTHRQTDTGNDNNQRPKLALGKNNFQQDTVYIKSWLRPQGLSKMADIFLSNPTMFPKAFLYSIFQVIDGKSSSIKRQQVSSANTQYWFLYPSYHDRITTSKPVLQGHEKFHNIISTNKNKLSAMYLQFHVIE